MLVTKAARIFTNNCKSYIPLLTIIAVIVTVTATNDREKSNLYIKGIINTYIVTVIKL